jgi:predicted esterase
MGSEERARRARTMAIVCTAMGIGAMIVAPMARSAAADPGPAPESSGWIEAGKVHAFVYPPRSNASSRTPVTVMLHGLGGYPQSACAPFVNVATDRGWLVCPRGEDAYGDGSRWRVRPDDDGRVVDASLDALAREHPDRVDSSSRRVIVGFSLGGTAAVRIAQSEEEGRGRYEGLVVIASQVHLDGALLERAGVKRVVLAAGDMDMTSAPLQADARALNRVGIAARFVSLGHFGHGYPADMADIMREPMAWVAGAVE